MAKYSFMWFRPIMFSQFYARFAGGVMQGFQLLDRFDHNSSEDLAEVPKLCTTSTALHYLELMSYYFYNPSVESPELCSTSTALLGEVPRTTTSNALHYLALLSYYFSTLSIHGPVTLGTDPPTFPSSTFNSTSSHFTWPVAGLSLSRNGK